MRILPTTLLLGTAAVIAGCATAPPPPVAVAQGGVCGDYGYVDVNNDGMISGDEWNRYRSGTYGYWDVNGDGRISRVEFEQCYRGGGFYAANTYNPEYWPHYWTGFDANNDGWLDANEYWSASTWARIDTNANGRIDSNEWMWWPR